MINMIRSINYSTRKNLVVVLTVISMICLPVFMVTVVMGASITEIDGAEYYCKMLGESFYVVIFASLILSCIPSSADAGDKTLNYELMAGHSRSRVFLARTAVGLFWGVIILAILYYYPLILFGCLGGWYKGVSIKDVLMHCLLSLLPLFRMSAFCIMLSSILRSAGKGIGFTYMAFEVGTIIWEVVSELFKIKEHTMPWIMGMLNLVELHTITNSRDYVIEGEKVTVYETALPQQLVISTVIVSLLMGGIYLIVAYTDFKRRDRD